MEWLRVVIFIFYLNSFPNGGQIFGVDSSLFAAASEDHHRHGLDEDEEGPLDPETAAARGRCSFPGRWEGNWFQSGFHQTIAIARHSINSKGKCLETEGDKFILYNERDHCYRCVVFHEKHLNVLQYKESFCIPERGSLRSMCQTITGDAYLYSMFRMDAKGVECPFQGPLTFTYNRGSGDCQMPVSTINSCLQNSRLLLNYQACPDVPGTESIMEELECLGSWKEGSSRYFLGLIQYRHSASLEDRFRCFAYEKLKKQSHFFSQMSPHHLQGMVDNSSGDVLVRVAQSGDATCNGLNPHEGSRVLSLRRAAIPKACNFPSWLLNGRDWHTLDERRIFSFDNSELKVRNMTEGGGHTLAMVAKCTQLQDNPTLDNVLLLIHATAGCQSGFVCMAIHRRDSHIIELQMGATVRRLEDACHPQNFDSNLQPYLTLISPSSGRRPCPNVGQFQIMGSVVVVDTGSGVAERQRLGGKKCAQEFSSLSMGCNALDMLQFHAECSTSIAEYACHGWWEEMGIRYLIASSISSPRTRAIKERFCFAYREDRSSSHPPLEGQERLRGNSDGNGALASGEESGEEPSPDFGRLLLFSTMTDSCHRNLRLGIEGIWAFNATSLGHCNGVNGAGMTRGQGGKAATVILTIFTCFITAISTHLHF